MDSAEGLRDAFLRLTSRHYATLHAEIEALHRQITALSAIWEALETAEGRLERQDDDLRARVAATESRIAALEQQLQALERELADSEAMASKISPLLVSLLSERAQHDPVRFAEAVAPVIGPAIRHQMRTARQDIIDALFPVIGQVISKAISEAIREMMLKIDTQLRQRFNLRSRWAVWMARLRGVSEAELMLRQALPCRVVHLFLIQRKTGLLLQHVQVHTETAQDTDLISGMLTAIQDFVSEAFGETEGELEDITYGDRRILLEGGRYAYLAVVLEGIEPPGFGLLMRRIVEEIQLQHEAALRDFGGDMDRLPDFRPALRVLAEPQGDWLTAPPAAAPLGRNQKLALTAGSLGMLLGIGLLIFGCVFTVRLWPAAFPGLPPTPTSTTTRTATATATATQSATATATPAPTWTATSTPTGTPSPTASFTPQPSPTPAFDLGILRGQVNVRQAATTAARILGALPAGAQVRVIERQGDWYRIQWPAEGAAELDGWVWAKYLQMISD